MKKQREKVKSATELEVINEVADDCISKLTEKNKEYLIDNPYAIDYHFSYCLYIRNNYIHNKDFSEVPFWAEPDHLSSEIIQAIFSRLIPEYEYGNQFVESIYDTKNYIVLRKEYKKVYGEYPDFIIKKYEGKIKLEKTHSISEIRTNDDIDIEHEIEVMERNIDKISKVREALISELAELIWETENIKKSAEKYGIPFSQIEKDIEILKNIFYEENVFIPLQVCFIPYKREIGKDYYIQYRRMLIDKLKGNPSLIEKFNPIYFRDRVLAKSVLKRGWALKYLDMYQDDEIMVRTSLKNDGTAIQYASRRFQQDREWVKFAIANSENGTIMSLDCMKPYRKDRELVYLACSFHGWNFNFVDKVFRDDFELAKISLMDKDALNSIFSSMSKRLRGNKELAMLDLEKNMPSVEYYSAKLRNDDDIAQKLFEVHGTNPYEWSYMSKRLQKKYEIEEW